MALALALSVIAATGTGIVIIARLIYAMAAHRTLPGFLANISPRFATPVPASVLTGALLIGLAWLYLGTSTVQAAFNDLIAVTGLLYAGFYVLTALAAMVYYRRRVLASPTDALTLGILPLGAAGFLAWLVGKSMQAAPAPQLWSLAAIVAAGLAAMLAARFGLRSAFFAIPRESDTPRH
jgi:amino acid transporter